MNRSFLKYLTTAAATGLVFHAPSLLACAACFGKSDSQLAVGMNWGIATLLGVVVCVLSGFAAFGIFLVKRSAEYSASAQDQAPDSNK